MTLEQLQSKAVNSRFQNTLAEGIRVNNSVAAGFGVPFIFRGSMMDLGSGQHGIRWCILRILANAADTGLTVEEIIDTVRRINGGDKYPDQTLWDVIRNVLETAGHVKSVQRSNREDASRNSRRFLAMRVRRNEWRIANGLRPLAIRVDRPRKGWFITKAGLDALTAQAK